MTASATATQPSHPSDSPISPRVLYDEQLCTALHAFTSQLLHAAINPWWSRISQSPASASPLHHHAQGPAAKARTPSDFEAEVGRIVRMAARSLRDYLQHAEAHGRLLRLAENDVPVIVTRHLRTWRSSSVGCHDDEDGDADESAEAMRRFRLYDALWPSQHVLTRQAEPRDGRHPAYEVVVSSERLRLLSHAIVTHLLREEELANDAAATLVRDIVTMLLRIAVTRGSCGWIWVRALQGALNRAEERGSLPVTFNHRLDWKKWLRPLASRAQEVVHRVFAIVGEKLFGPTSASASRRQRPEGPAAPQTEEKEPLVGLGSTEAQIKDKTSDPHSEAEPATQPCHAASDTPSHAASTASRLASSYLLLLCSILDLKETYLGTLALALLSASQRLLLPHPHMRAFLLRHHSSLAARLAQPDLYVDLVARLRPLLLVDTPAGPAFPPRAPDPTEAEQAAEYEAFLRSLARALAVGGDGAGIAAPQGSSASFLAQIHPRLILHLLPPGEGDSTHARSHAHADADATALSKLDRVLAPFLSPAARWTRADLVGRLLEAVVAALLPDLTEAAAEGGGGASGQGEGGEGQGECEGEGRCGDSR